MDDFLDGIIADLEEMLGRGEADGSDGFGM